jgi:hypothetical protein
VAIEDLVEVIPPPATPRDAGTLDQLGDIEKRLGLQLPSDYREFTIRYGTGSFLDGYLQIYNPFAVDLLDAATTRYSRCRHFHESGALPWAPIPASPGVFEIGGNENGHTILYLTEGNPDEWPLLVVPHDDSPHFERWELQLGTFLARALMNEIQTQAMHACNQPVQPDERHFYQAGS